MQRLKQIPKNVTTYYKILSLDLTFKCIVEESCKVNILYETSSNLNSVSSDQEDKNTKNLGRNIAKYSEDLWRTVFLKETYGILL